MSTNTLTNSTDLKQNTTDQIQNPIDQIQNPIDPKQNNINSKENTINDNLIYCKLKIAENCLKIKTRENMKQFWGEICYNCRGVRKLNKISEYYKKRYQEYYKKRYQECYKKQYQEKKISKLPSCEDLK